MHKSMNFRGRRRARARARLSPPAGVDGLPRVSWVEPVLVVPLCAERMPGFALGGKGKKKRGVAAVFGSEDDEEAAKRERLEVQRKRAVEMGMQRSDRVSAGGSTAITQSQAAPSSGGSDNKARKKAADYSSLMAEETYACTPEQIERQPAPAALALSELGVPRVAGLRCRAAPPRWPP